MSTRPPADRDRIPFNRATFSPAALVNVAAVLESGLVAGDGPFCRRCEAFLTRSLGSAGTLLTTSATDAMELAAMLLDLHDGDEVIVPSFTFPTTALAFHLRGARPVFCDIRADTLNLDESLLAELVSERTKAVVVVHYAGVACAMDAICALCAQWDIPVFEDNAHGLFGSYRGRPLGSIGTLAALSFHETKNLSCGEGGALVVNDPGYLGRACVLRDKGTDRRRFERGDVERYQWVDLGSSFGLSDLNAAVLLSQLDDASSIQARRRRIWERYDECLREWAPSRAVRLPEVPDDVDHAYHLYHLRFPDRATRESVRLALASEGIGATTHYEPLHSSPFGRAVGRGECPQSEAVSQTLLRLPFFTDMTDAQVDRVVASLRRACGS